MTIYQKELLRMLPTLECEGKYNPDTEMLDITYHKIPMCCQNNMILAVTAIHDRR